MYKCLKANERMPGRFSAHSPTMMQRREVYRLPTAPR